ncbi:MAG: cell division protein SepF [Halobacteriaceae archaeon]
MPGLMDRILGGGRGRDLDDYVELDSADVDGRSAEASMQVFVAEIHGQQDVMAIKDAIYDGDLVVADITRLRTEDRTIEHITDELKQVADEVGGDIAHSSEDQIIVTPAGVKISREKLNRD